MMKNKKMGILAVLVMLVAVTLNSVGGTYAKYISQYGVTDTARVARWSFNDTAVRTVDLFEQSYTKDTDKHTYVASSDMYKVIAPGTEGSYAYQIEGTAETNFEITKNVKVTNSVVYPMSDGKLYDPVEFSFDGGKSYKRLSDIATNVTYDTVKKAYVYELNTADGKVYAANTVLSGNDAIKDSIAWRWRFDKECSTNEAGVETCKNPYSNDFYDTELGKQINLASPQYTIEATIGVSVVQTDKVATEGVADKAHTSINLSSAEKDAVVKAWGYDENNAKLSFDGKTVKGSVKAYSADSALFKKYNVTDASPYFGVVKVTVPDGYKLYATSLYEGGEKEINVDPADNAALVIISFRKNAENKIAGKSTYELRKGTDKIPFEINYDLDEIPAA